MKYTLQTKLMAVRHYLDGHGGYKLLFEKKLAVTIIDIRMFLKK